jgi:hypothetical protein
MADMSSAGYCYFTLLSNYLTLFGVIPLIIEVSLYVIVCTALLSLLYGSGIACGLSYSWIMRYNSLRRVSLDDDDEDFADRDEDEYDGKAKYPGGGGSLAHLIKRDSFERYLFIQRFFGYATKLWSNVLFSALILSLIAAVYIYISAIWEYSEYGTVNQLYIFACFFDCVFMLGLICTLMHANSAVDLIRVGLVNSSKDDYKLIGSREEWIGFIDEAPCYWYIFGFAITRSWLFGFIGGALTAVVGAFVMSKLE